MTEAKTLSTRPLMDLVRQLHPICRSITGDGVRHSLAIVGDRLPLEVHEVATGTDAFDWQVPEEWNIRDAYVADANGNRIIDFRANNLHVLNYSVPINKKITREELDQHLFSIPEYPDWIPYRTSYYEKRWGFCLTQNQRDNLGDAEYQVVIDSDLGPGHLTYAECYIPGQLEDEVLLYTHICHPSLCNDNLTGIAVLTAVGEALLNQSRRFSYRLVFAPGTIGSIVWLSRNQERLKDIRHGLVIGLLGDEAPFTYKQTRDPGDELNVIAQYVLSHRSGDNRIVPFEPYGYDERQFGSPGINLSVGRLTRSVNGGYPQYHTSADDLSIVSESRLEEALDTVIEILDTLEENQHYRNKRPFCEPQLGKRGLYRTTGGTNLASRESAMLWLLNQCDGSQSVMDIAIKSGIGFADLVSVAKELADAGLLGVEYDGQEK